MWRFPDSRLPLCLGIAALAWAGVRLGAHSGPPFPIVSDGIAGPYEVSLWTDPDATDDGSPGGQFWVVIAMADGSAPPPDTSALVTIRPLDRPGAEQSIRATPVGGNVSRQFAALVMDHEGPFAVRAEIRSARGTARVDATADATYDLRPPRVLLVLYLLPFVAVGVLWLKLLRSRRDGARSFNPAAGRRSDPGGAHAEPEDNSRRTLQ